MAKQTKKSTSFPAVTTINGESAVLTDSNGLWKKITLANLRQAILGTPNLNAMYSGVFIMSHRKSDNIILAWKPEDWTAQQNAGEIADGVLIVDGGRKLVIAPNEADSNGLYWSSSNASGGAYTTSNRLLAQEDYAGKANTTAILNAFPNDGTSYAAKFCASYSRANANGYGILAGSWWLPSLGELFLIWANFHKINYALSLITGADQLPAAAYWSSTEYSATGAWYLNFNNGTQTVYTKSTYRSRVRPVSAFA